jgi:acetyl-CoA carboxylase biotin carboxyl carrier protein
LSLTAQDIAEITRLLEESAFDELELELNGMKIHLRRAGIAAAASRAVAPPVAAPENADGSAPLEPGLVAVRAPLLGTFYRAPKPGAPPFVEIGARVEPETIVGIIEVMKLMNTVRAGTHGIVRTITARDGALVEYGETLLALAPRESR